MAEEEVAAASESDFAIKLLLSNKEAGSLIGKGGSAIVALQAKTGCKIRVSKAEDFFPGTQDRVILITGPFSSVVDSVNSIVESVYLGFPEPLEPGEESVKKNVPANPESRTITLVIPAAAAGVIIGRGGGNIKAVSSKAGSHIQLEGKDRQIHGLDERLVYITGNMESALISAQTILEKLSEDSASVYDHMSTSYRHLSAFVPNGQNGNGFQGNLPGHMAPSHRPLPGAMMHFPAARVQGRRPPLAHARPDPSVRGGGPNGGGMVPYAGGGGAPPPSASMSMGPSGGTTLTVQLPDSVIPAIVGKAGAVIRSIQANTGARVRISAKGDFVAGTTDRIVTITGSGQQANAAYMMIAELAGFV